MPVKVYSGIAPPQALLDAMAASGRVKPTQPQPQPQPSGPAGGGEPPPIPPRPAAPPAPATSDEGFDDAPPSYEDAMAEVLEPVDGPRREYNPPDATSSRTNESGADAKPSVQPEKDHEPAAFSNTEANSSSETFDMLPSTPPESQSNSPPTSPVGRQHSMIKGHRPPRQEDNPPLYQPAQDQLHIPQNTERRPSGSGFRPMNLGVPSRKPVPRSPSRGD